MKGAGELSPTAPPGFVVAGVDEAGLGPLVGPLTIGYSAFRVPRPRSDPWRLLRRTVTRDPADGQRLAVADSKKVFTRTPGGLKRLETTALAFLGLLDPEGRAPAEPHEILFRRLLPAPAYLETPWYGLLPRPPLECEEGSLELRVELLRRDLEAHRIALVDAGVRVVPAAELNDSYARTENKALSVWTMCLEVLRHLWESHGAETPTVVVDVLGGRVRYGPLLARGFPEAVVTRERERDGISVYRIVERGDGAGRRMRLEFRVRGEERSFPVALSSCLAKYAREVVMHAFNAYFASLQPGLRPTAGYRNDAQRWLRDAVTVISRVERRILVRQR